MLEFFVLLILLFGCHVVGSITFDVQEHADKDIVIHVVLLG